MIIIDEHREQMIASAKRHAKQVAMLCNTLEEAVRWSERGVQIIVFSSDVAMIRNAYSSVIARLRPGTVS
jgi:2-keto-3-deoxy-L-rhamnonate aldolase RhmA